MGHLCIFGCIGYAKVVSPHLKKLDDRSRILVHLGTEPGSKAYRMLDLETRKVVVSRDVVFDESKGWNWNQKLDESCKEGDFTITLGEFGNHGIQVDEVHEHKVEDDERKDTTKEIIEVEREEELEEEEKVETEEETAPALRRSQREVTKPKYLDDYILLIEEEEEGERLLMLINCEPQTYEEAQELKEWIVACEEEIASIYCKEWNVGTC